MEESVHQHVWRILRDKLVAKRWIGTKWISLQEETCTVMGTASGGFFFQEVCTVCLVTYDRCVRKLISHNQETRSRLFGFGSSMAGPSVMKLLQVLQDHTSCPPQERFLHCDVRKVSTNC